MFSYSSYLGYLSKISKKKIQSDLKYLNFEQLQNNVIAICSPSKENFWRNLYVKKISFREYKNNCLKIKKNVLFDEPVQYLTSKCHFYGIELCVTKGVLAPQPDTEILVQVFKLISGKIWNAKTKIDFIEIGAGTGAIPISLSFLSGKKFSFVSTDINKKAIDVAKKNAYSLGANNVKFINCDLFSKVSGKFDVLISNPPYISIEKYWSSHSLVKKQPKTSLVAKNQGVYFYHKIIRESSYFLKKKSLVILEIDNFVVEKVKTIITNYFPDAKVEMFKDFSDNWRVIAYYF